MSWDGKNISAPLFMIGKQWSGGSSLNKQKRNSVSIGLDLGESAVKIVALKKEANSFKLIKWGLLEFDRERLGEDPQKLTTVLRIWLTEIGVNKKAVVSAISGSSLNVRPVTLPDMSDKEFEQAAQWEVRPQIFLNEKDSVTITFPLEVIENNGISQKTGAVVAIEKRLVDQKISILKSSGVKLKGLKIDSFALSDFLVDGQVGTEEVIGVIDLGANSVKMAFKQGQRVLFARDIYSVDRSLTAEIAEVYQLPPRLAEKVKRKIRLTVNAPGREESTGDQLKARKGSFQSTVFPILNTLADEIAISLQYFHSFVGKNISKIILSGGGALMEGIDQFLSQKLGIPVCIAQPLEGIIYDPETINLKDLKKLTPRLATALALAKGELYKSKLSTVDLLKQERLRKRKLPLIAVLLSVIISMLTGTFFIHTKLVSRASQYDEGIKESRLILANLETEVNRLREFELKKLESDRKMRVISSLKNFQPRWSWVLRDISHIIPPHVWLTEFKATKDDATENTSQPTLEPNDTAIVEGTAMFASPSGYCKIILNGKTARQSLIQEFVSHLENSSRLKDVKLVRIEGRKEINENTGTFQVNAKVKFAPELKKGTTK